MCVTFSNPLNELRDENLSRHSHTFLLTTVRMEGCSGVWHYWSKGTGATICSTTEKQKYKDVIKAFNPWTVSHNTNCVPLAIVKTMSKAVLKKKRGRRREYYLLIFPLKFTQKDCLSQESVLQLCNLWLIKWNRGFSCKINLYANLQIQRVSKAKRNSLNYCNKHMQEQIWSHTEQTFKITRVQRVKF